MPCLNEVWLILPSSIVIVLNVRNKVLHLTNQITMVLLILNKEDKLIGQILSVLNFPAG